VRVPGFVTEERSIRDGLSILLGAMVVAGWAYWGAAWWATRRFLGGARAVSDGIKPDRFAAPLAGRFSGPSEYAPQAGRLNESFTESKNYDIQTRRPNVSILKPLKGADENAYENFRCFCLQDYPDYEILFGVAGASDPAAALVRRLQREFPGRAIRLIVTLPGGANPKSATLRTLADAARGEVLVISDADVRVAPDYLSRVVAPLADEAVGLVTCPYRGLGPRGVAARLEALHMEAVFLPSVVFARRVMGQRVGMGATLAVRRADLARAGGYASIADHLADDYQVAVIIEKLGLRTHLSDHVVSCVLGKTRFADQWAREVRWARGIRVTCPGRYPGLLVTYPVCWAAALCAVSGFTRWAVCVLGLTLALRWLIAWDVGSLLGEPRDRRSLLWLPVREGMSFLVWCAGSVGSAITWRGERFVLLRDGRLAPPGPPGGLIRGLVRRLDAFLRKRQGIFEYCDEPDCVLRISMGTCEEETELSDGTRLHPGDAMCELHLFNEHMPQLSGDGANIRWAVEMHRRFRHSLTKLAKAFGTDRRFDAVKGLHCVSVFGSRDGPKQTQRMAGRLHFDVFDFTRPPTLASRLHQAGENLLILGLVWTFNPAGLRTAKLARGRYRLCMSRGVLLGNYGGRDEKGADSSDISRYERNRAQAAPDEQAAAAEGSVEGS
jgi:ceramide glucosyltransferase